MCGAGGGSSWRSTAKEARTPGATPASEDRQGEGEPRSRSSAEPGPPPSTHRLHHTHMPCPLRAAGASAATQVGQSPVQLSLVWVLLTLAASPSPARPPLESLLVTRVLSTGHFLPEPSSVSSTPADSGSATRSAQMPPPREAFSSPACAPSSPRQPRGSAQGPDTQQVPSE